MKKIFELIKTFDIEPFEMDDGELFRFRIEISKGVGDGIFFGVVYRLETYRIHPTFPQINGEPSDFLSDALLFVKDDVFDAVDLSGQSLAEVIEKFQKELHNFFDV
jgi:hypothetical protein